MKKIVAALSEETFPENVFRFISDLQQEGPLQVTFVYVSEDPIITAWSVTGMPPDPMWFPVLEERDPQLLAQTRRQLVERCAAQHISYRIREQGDEGSVAQLKKESRFADLLVVGHDLFFGSPVGGMDWDHFARTVRELECPTIVLPDDYQFPKQNIIAYDGSSSSVFALKQFYTVLPELSTHPTYLVYRQGKKDEGIPDRNYIEELASPHFPDLVITELTGSDPDAFSNWVGQYASPLIICGALGRGALSRLFHKSFSYQHLADQRVPVFIAHK
ncbi:hypothetical protein [Flaviaesturariibacter terrae]